MTKQVPAVEAQPSAPSSAAVDLGAIKLDIKKEPGKARSIQLLIAKEDLPELE